MATYNLFISHSWTYHNEYEQLVNLLNQQISYSFNYKNYSVPKNDPIHYASNDNELRNAIENQIRPASCIIILTGVYATYSKWINIEIEIAKRLGKRIIAVNPWDSDRTSQVVKNNADYIVGWRGSSIVNAIKA